MPICNNCTRDYDVATFNPDMKDYETAIANFCPFCGNKQSQ